MKAALLIEVNKPLVLEEVRPMPLQHGQVLVEVLASGICGAQLSEIRGEKGNIFPRLMGHEAAVRVLDTGIGVKLQPGDKCVAHWRPGAGIESDFPRYDYHGETITSGLITTFSEQAVISENRLTKIPEDAPDELAALLGCSLSTALGVIEQEAKLLMGESALVIGYGGLGQNLVRAARMRRASRIDVVESNSSKHIEATAFGADCCAFRVGHLTFGKYDVVIDTTGNASAIMEGIEVLAPSGRMILVGQPKPRENVMLANARHLFEGDGKTILATQGGRFNPAKDVPRYYNLWKSGQLDLSGIVTHRLSLDEINVGIELVRNGQAGRVMILP